MKPAPIVAILAALAVAGGGYWLTGRPGVGSSPAPQSSLNPDLTPEAEQASKALMNNFGDVRAWLTLSDALIRNGKTETAVVALDSALEQIPGNPELWSQMGVALVAHASGEVVPSARLAFDRASRLDPDHPAPPYFLGLAWLQAGQPDEALKAWTALRQRSPDDAPWVETLDRQMVAAEMMRKMGVGPGAGSKMPADESPPNT